MYSWLVYYSLFALVAVKQSLFWLFLWQNKEYRGDKMRDYLSLPESRKVVFDRWTIARLFLIIAYSLFAGLSQVKTGTVFNQILDLIFITAFSIESLEFLLRIALKKPVKLPTWSQKAKLISLLSILSILALPLLSTDGQPTDFPSTLMIIILLIPLIIGYWILMVFPFDAYIKYKLFQKAKLHRSQLPKLHSVAISGAFGKTSTKEILAYLLEHTSNPSTNKPYQVAKTIKNQNANVSCARKTLQLTTNDDIFLCELGAYNRGDGNEICEFLQPQTAIITGLNLQHFSLFGSEENIIQAESESLNFLPKGNSAIINWTSPMCRKITIPDHIQIITCAVDDGTLQAKDVSYFASEIKFGETYTTFTLSGKNVPSPITLKINTIDRGSIQNILHAIAFCELQDISIESLSPLLEQLPAIEGRTERLKKPFGSIIYNQYNNFDGILNSLEVLSYSKGQKIVVLDDISELGKKSTTIHEDLGKRVALQKPDKVVLLGRSFSKVVAQSLVSNTYPNSKILYWDGKNTNQIIEHIQKDISNASSTHILLSGYQSKNFLEL